MSLKILLKDRLNEKFVKAVSDNNLEQVKLLVEKGADINFNNSYALKVCVMNDYLNLFIYLKKENAHTNFEDVDLLEQACNFGSLNIVKNLIKNGDDYTKNDNKAIKNALDTLSHKIIYYFVLECQADIDIIINYEKSSNEIVRWAKEHKATELKEKFEHVLEVKNKDINKIKI